MNLGKDTLRILSEKALEAAQKAAEYIASYNHKDLAVELKQIDADGGQPQGGASEASQVVTEVDLKSQEIILDLLQSTIEEYDFGVLTEEKADDKSRFEKDYFWCIDPLDGTLPFSQGYQGYSVSIALVSKEGIPVIGVVCNPVNMDVYVAYQGGGVSKNGEIWSDDKRPGDNYFTFINDRSFTRHEKFKDITLYVNNMAIECGYSTFKMLKQGGAVMNAMWVLENRPACYFKLPKEAVGGGSLWDFAATACIFKEMGLPVSDAFGNPLNFNQKETTFMNKTGVLFYDVDNLNCKAMLQKFIK
ncbi:3'(2'),5'-bisphosphate nucleotidase CysQ family protein [Plebeiibacterium sediminum]|uniref:Inositol monophosphatase n=1 Tax=Plebeiibacterium sediminum TaxID=2992112 RepID=A0AAE3M8S4_9BACT|nr:inositol monophosphatase family protein [Plebeiobacterium sediminum]MCW3789027.1 hypothetical protein [Plebeiobacterium sediminum]